MDRTTPGLWARIRQIGGDVIKIFFDRDTSPRCAATAFFGFLSLFPAIATAVLIFGLVADRQMLVGTFKSLDLLLPQAAMSIVGEQLLSITSQPPAALGIGLLISVPLAIWSGSRGVDALLYAMSQVRGESPRRNFFAAAAVSIAFTVGGAVFLVIALLTVAGLPALVPFPTGDELLLFVIRWPILLLLTFGVLLVLYRWGPDRHPRRWRYLWPGAVLASLLWIIAGAAFSIYVENWGNYNETFGSVSAAVVLLLWMYNSAQIFVLGAGLNAVLESEAKAASLPSPAVPMALAAQRPRHRSVVVRVGDAIRPRLPAIGVSLAVAAILVAALVDNYDNEAEA
jgi:membrane protein